MEFDAKHYLGFLRYFPREKGAGKENSPDSRYKNTLRFSTELVLPIPNITALTKLPLGLPACTLRQPLRKLPPTASVSLRELHLCMGYLVSILVQAMGNVPPKV